MALVAELVAGEIGRILGLKIPELVFAQVEEMLGRNEPDAEIRDLLRKSVGLNLALDYLPGSTMFDLAAGDTSDPATASMAVWFDAFTMNIDRTVRNANLLRWHSALYFIDHGAALYWQHNWETAEQSSRSSFPAIRDHILLSWATQLAEADAMARALLSRAALSDILTLAPDAWLSSSGEDPGALRSKYLELLSYRLETSSNFVEEAIRAHASLL